MAENLGDAVLVVRADTTQLDAGFRRAEDRARQAGATTRTAFAANGRALQTAANGLQYYVDAQGRMRDASGKFVSQLQQQAAGLTTIGQAAKSASPGMELLGAALTRVAGQLALLETARRAAFFTGNQIKELDSAGAAVKTLGVNSEDLISRLKALSVELKGNVSVVQLTKAAYDVASSGFADSASATQILKASALGAQGGFAELDDVVRAITGVINAYGLSADRATNIVDTFLQTQNDGVITVRQYAAEIGNVASVAAAGGVSLEELNAAIATATLRGVPVPQTFTGIRQALSSIIKPSDEAARLARTLGLQYNVAALQSKGFAGVLADVQAKTGGSADKLAILLGSVEAQAAVQPLLNDKLVKYNELLEKQKRSAGAAASASQINSETISGGLTQIGNGLSNLAITLDKALKPLFQGLIKDLADILLKLQQVSTLTPEAIKKREQQATRIIETAKQSSPNFNTRVFFGTPLVSPNTEIVFDGKTFKGTITGVREDLLQYLLNKDLQNINKPQGSRPVTPPPKPPPSTPVIDRNAIAGAELAANSERSKAAAAIERLNASRIKNSLNEVGRAGLDAELNLNEKLRALEQSRLELARELAKTVGFGDGRDGNQSLERIATLQGQIRTGELDIAAARLEGARAIADAVRSQQERVRQQRLETQSAADRLDLTRRQTALESAAAIAQGQVSATAQLELQQRVTLAEKLRALDAARGARATELARGPEADRVVLRDIQDRIARANADVRQAYADAGLSLTTNAKTAAEALRGAQQNLQSILRGGFEYITPELQQQQIDRARAAIQPLVDRGVIRTGIDISTPEKLFAVAGFAEQLVPAQKALQNAIAENVNATNALAKKDWNVYVQVPSNATPVPIPRT